MRVCTIKGVISMLPKKDRFISAEEEEEEFYSRKAREQLLEQDELSSEEDGVMEGYEIDEAEGEYSKFEKPFLPGKV